MNDGEFSIRVFFNLNKDFNVVPSDILIVKLSKLNIQGTALDSFRSHLCERKEVVNVNGHILDNFLTSHYVSAPYGRTCLDFFTYNFTKILVIIFQRHSFGRCPQFIKKIGENMSAGSCISRYTSVPSSKKYTGILLPNIVMLPLFRHMYENNMQLAAATLSLFNLLLASYR